MTTPGYIRLHRKLLKWRWYRNPVVRDVFIHLLLTANYTDGAAEAFEVKRGQAIFSYDSLSSYTGFTVKQCRNAIAKLKQTGELSVWTNRHFSVATITNYDEYQADDFTEDGQTKGRQRADKGQTKGRQRATSYKEKKEEEIKKENYKRKKQSVFSVEGASFDVNKLEGMCSVE